MILELCKGVHCVDLGESFPTHIFLQNLASIQPRTSPVKFARPSNAANAPGKARDPILRRLDLPRPGVEPLPERLARDELHNLAARYTVGAVRPPLEYPADRAVCAKKDDRNLTITLIYVDYK